MLSVSNRILIVRSEVWRWYWCLRTSVSVAVLTFLLLFPTTSSFLLNYCNGSFTAFVCVLVKDVTAGATLVNCWSCIWGTILSSVLIAIVIALGGDGPLSTGYILLALFGAVLTMQYFEVPIMGKKLGVSFIPQVFLALHQSSIYRWKTLWSLVLSVLLGCICGLIGVFLPPPPRIAGYEVSGRLSYCTQTMSSLLQSVLQGWLQQPIHYQEVESLLLRNTDHCRVNNSERKGPDRFVAIPQLSSLQQESTKETLVYANLKHKSKYWRKVILLVQGSIAFKRAYKYRIGWLHRSSQPWAKERHSRLEVIVFLQEEVEVLLRRNNEARFGPSRWKALNIFKRYVDLVRSILAILTLLERQLQTMDNFPHLHHIYRAFFTWPSFRAELFAFSQSLCMAMSDLHHLVQCGGAPDHNNSHHKLAAAKAVQSLANVIQRRDRFNAEYFLLRKRLYYGLHNDGKRKQRNKTLALHAPVLFNMNSVMFLLDTMVEQFVLFLSEEEMMAAEEHWMLLSSASPHHQPHNTVTATMMAWQSVWRDLFPTQNQLFCFSLSACSWRWTPLIRTRFLGSFKVALAMTIAALYGLLAERPQPALASFTIAYLAGGAVSGINIMTCINRGIGTVVACVFVVFIVISAQQAASDVTRNVIVGFAVVLFQLPCTYIRSYPLYSYAGTVAGFTAALLLIDPKQPALVSIAINRIIDTIVGLFIYLLVELAAFAQPSESALLSAMEGVVKGIDRRFSNFHERLLRAASYSNMSSSSSDVPTMDDGSNSLEDMNNLLRTQRDFFPFYKSEPRLFFSTPALPDRLLQEGLRWQEQAVLALQTMVWVVQSCDSVVAFHRESRFLVLETRVNDNKPSVYSNDGSNGDGIEMLNILEEGRRIRAMSMTNGAFPDYEAILLPLKGQYEEVEAFVSQALAFLSLAIKELRQNPCDNDRKYSKDSDPLTVLRKLNDTRQWQMLRALSLVVPSSSNKKKSNYTIEDEGDRELLVAAPTSFAEEENRTVERLFASFQRIVDGLQNRIVEESGPTEAILNDRINYAKEDERDEEKRIASNREMKAVNALLSSTKDLLQALRGLAAVVSRMQAHRDLRITQDPMKGVNRYSHQKPGKDHV